MLAYSIEDEALKGETVLCSGGHQSAEVKVHIVHEGSIANTALEALQAAGQVGDGQLEQAHLERQLHRVPLDHLEATVIVSGHACTCGQITALDIRELEQATLTLEKAKRKGS